MNQYVALTISLLRNFFRDKQSLGFTLAFPVVFFLIFGAVLSGGGAGQVATSFSVYVASGAEGADVLNTIIENTEGFNVHRAQSESDVRRYVADLESEFGLAYDGEKIRFFYNPTLVERNSYLSQLARGIASDFDREMAGLADLMVVERENVALRDAVSDLEYVLPGIIALGLTSAGLFTLSVSFLRFREKKILKRLVAAPMSQSAFMFALVTTRIVGAAASTAVLLAMARLVFGMELVIDWALFLPFVVVSTLAMMAVGVLITLITRRAETGGQIAGIMLTLMIFFSGIYFPTEFLPPYFRAVARVLPLTYVSDGLRYTMNVEHMEPSRFTVMILVMLVASLALISTAARRKDWQET